VLIPIKQRLEYLGDSGIHICVIFRDGSKNILTEIPKVYPWLTLLYSRTRYKDAVDHTLTFVASILHTMIPTTTFVLVSSDMFIYELESLLKGISHPTYVINPRDTSYLTTLIGSMYPLNRDEHYQLVYLTQWTGTQKSFCDKYGIPEYCMRRWLDWNIDMDKCIASYICTCVQSFIDST